MMGKLESTRRVRGGTIYVSAAVAYARVRLSLLLLVSRIIHRERSHVDQRLHEPFRRPARLVD